MEAHLPPDVLAGLKEARMRDAIKKSRLRVHADDKVYSVLELNDDGFTLRADDAPFLRGLVDLYDGSRHISQCLVIRAEREDDVVKYDYKRNTTATRNPPKDFAVDENAPIALIGR